MEESVFISLWSPPYSPPSKKFTRRRRRRRRRKGGESGGGEGADGRSTLINQDSAACTSNGGTLSETQHPSHPADAIPPLLIDLSQLCHLFRGNLFSLHLNQFRGRARGIMEFCSFAGLASVGLVNCICVWLSLRCYPFSFFGLWNHLLTKSNQ